MDSRSGSTSRPADSYENHPTKKRMREAFGLGESSSREKKRLNRGDHYYEGGAGGDGVCERWERRGERRGERDLERGEGGRVEGVGFR